MRILLKSERKRHGILTEHNGIELEWTSHTWSRIKHENDGDVFGLLFLYWDSKGEAFQNKVSELYLAAHDLLSSDQAIGPRDPELSRICCELVDLHNLDEVEELMKGEYINMDSSFLDDYGSHDKDQTYLKRDYFKLVAFSTVVKALTPIWGEFTYEMMNEVGTKKKELYALLLINDSQFMKTEALMKLKRYCTVSAEKIKDKSNASITLQMPETQIPFYFLAGAIVKRIPPHRFQVESKNLITGIFNFLKDEKVDLMKGPNMRRVNNSEEQDRDSQAEQFRIAQAVPDYVIECAKTYITDTPRLAKDAIEDMTDEQWQMVLKAREKMEKIPSFFISDFHHPIVTKVLHRQMHLHTTQHLDLPSMQSAIAVAYVKLIQLGFQDLAELIIAERIDKDPNAMKIGGFSMNALQKPHELALKEKYFYISKRSKSSKAENEGLKAIQALVKFLNTYDWDIDQFYLTDIRNSYAKFLLL